MDFTLCDEFNRSGCTFCRYKMNSFVSEFESASLIIQSSCEQLLR